LKKLIEVKFSLATGESLLFTPGLPADHGGHLLNGATASHVKAGFGEIVLQEFGNNFFMTILFKGKLGISRRMKGH
jgi:hypothetical protein